MGQELTPFDDIIEKHGMTREHYLPNMTAQEMLHRLMTSEATIYATDDEAAYIFIFSDGFVGYQPLPNLQ